MKVEHLNYCRQMLAQFKAMAAVPNIEPEKRAVVDHTIDLCRASQKFLLPENGRLLPDNELRALDDSEPLRLPHPFIALEFTAQLSSASGAMTPAKRVIFCREDEDGIYVRPAAHITANGFWMIRSDAFIPKTNYLDRSDPKNVKVFAEYQDKETPRDGFKHVVVVLGFLNALACSNVHIERSEAKKSGKKIKAALPFDSYHILTIDTGKSGESTALTSGGSHRSPREHLRRGHIVRPGEGRKPFWRNATVVCAGRSFNKVEKDYRIKNSKLVARTGIEPVSAP